MTTTNDERQGIRITVEDLETGETETRDVPSGDYFLVTTEPAHVAHINTFANGTQVVTIKGRTRR